MEGDGFPFGSAPSAQWGEGRADKVIYLHLSTSCNGWHFHLSLKLHHLAAEPPHPPTRRAKYKGVGQREPEQTGWTRGSRKENRLSRQQPLFPSFQITGGGVWELLPHHPSAPSRTQISDRSELQLGLIP